MNKFAVAFINFFDNDLQIKIVEIGSAHWKHAFVAAYPDYAEFIGNKDMETAKDDAWNQDWAFEVKKID